MDPQPRLRLALFGGTFDPPHNGHLHIARHAREECRLDQVVFLPCRQSPHKEEAPGASADQRAGMLRAAVAHLPWAEVSTYEIDQPGPSFSWRTAEWFARQMPPGGDSLFWILGADQWRTLHTWSRPERLAALLTFIVFPRGDSDPEPRPEFRAVFLSERHEASATRIRALLREGLPVTGLVPKPVEHYIRSHHLYGPASRAR